MKQLWKFNPLTDLHSVTIYGRQIKRDTGVAIVRAKVDQALLLDKVKLAPDHRVTTYGKYELHSWVHDKGSKHERSMTGTFYKPEVMVFGASSQEVLEAIDVLDGKKPNFASVQPAAAGLIPSGAILIVGATGFSNVDLPCKCPLVKQLDSALVVVGENSGSIFVQGKLLTKETGTAQQVKSVIDGAVALAALAKADDADLIKLINSVKVDVADKVVSVDANAAVDAVWAQAQKAAAEAKKHSGWGHGRPGCPGAGCPIGPGHHPKKK